MENKELLNDLSRLSDGERIEMKNNSMKRNLLILSIIGIILMCPVSFLMAQDKTANYGKATNEILPYENFKKPYKNHFLIPIEFYGAGREKVAPKDLKEVRIGFLGPLTTSVMVPQGLQMLQGATMAMEEANKKGGYKGLPFKIMAHNDAGLWGAAANEVVKMDDEKVWAFLGSIDDVVSHVALRAALKLEIYMVCTGDPDPTFTETNIPWQCRVISDDRQSGYALVNYIHKKMGYKRVAMIRVNGRYGRVGVKEYADAAQRLGYPFVIEERFNDGETDFKSQVERVKKTNPDAILLWGNAKESGLILKQIRASGLKQPVFGSDRMVSPEFLKIAGPLAEGIVTTCQYNPNSTDAKYQAFKANYIKRFKQQPDVFAVHAYDGMSILIDAIKKVGLNRVLIRDVMAGLKVFQNYPGVSGKIVFDHSWNDVGDIYMATVRNGKFEFTVAPPMEVGSKKYNGPKAPGSYTN
ncbi:MAG: amino acid ABC transporter substrate-binding protein [Mariniphaga sp.]|nr:amino acid ABC transporter substrate-binding protein [Mariniphaga sp.]